MGIESEGWTGLDGEGEAEGGLRMMPLEGEEQPPPGNLAERQVVKEKCPVLSPPAQRHPALRCFSLLLPYCAFLPFLQLLQPLQGPEATEVALNSEHDSHENPIIKSYGK